MQSNCHSSLPVNSELAQAQSESMDCSTYDDKMICDELVEIEPGMRIESILDSTQPQRETLSYEIDSITDRIKNIEITKKEQNTTGNLIDLNTELKEVGPYSKWREQPPIYTDDEIVLYDQSDIKQLFTSQKDTNHSLTDKVMDELYADQSISKVLNRSKEGEIWSNEYTQTTTAILETDDQKWFNIDLNTTTQKMDQMKIDEELPEPIDKSDSSLLGDIKNSVLSYSKSKLSIIEEFGNMINYLKGDLFKGFVVSISRCINCKETPANGFKWVLFLLLVMLVLFVYFVHYYLLIGILVSIIVARYILKKRLKDKIAIGAFLALVGISLLSTCIYLLLLLYLCIIINWIRTAKSHITVIDALILAITVLSGIFLFFFNQWICSDMYASFSRLLLVQLMLFVFILFNMGMVRCILKWISEAIHDKNTPEKSENDLKSEYYSDQEENNTDNATATYESNSIIPLAASRYIKDLCNNSTLYRMYKFSMFWIYIAIVSSIISSFFLSIKSTINVNCILGPMNMLNTY